MLGSMYHRAHCNLWFSCSLFCIITQNWNGPLWVHTALLTGMFFFTKPFLEKFRLIYLKSQSAFHWRFTTCCSQSLHWIGSPDCMCAKYHIWLCGFYFYFLINCCNSVATILGQVFLNKGWNVFKRRCLVLCYTCPLSYNQFWLFVETDLSCSLFQTNMFSVDQCISAALYDNAVLSSTMLHFYKKKIVSVICIMLMAILQFY